MSKESNKIFSLVNNIFCSLFLFALISVNFLPQSTQNDSEDLVYCPLQKTWVKRDLPGEPVKVEFPLGEICSSQKNKESFLSDLGKIASSNQIIFDKQDEANLFFNYLEKGKKAFAYFESTQNHPKHQLVRNALNEKGANTNYKIEFEPNRSEEFVLSQLSRPPTVRKTSKFDFQIVYSLEKISHNINPRSPPFSI